LGFAWLAVAVVAAGCSGLLDLAAPQLLQDGGGATFEASVDVDVGSGDAGPEPPGDDGYAAPDASLDAPLLDVTADVVLDTTVKDAVAEATADVAIDQGSGGPDAGVLCGFGTNYCAGNNAFCCETADDAGMPVLACIPSESACTGYYIECANDNDCRNSSICCHYASAMRCETPTGSGVCPGGGSGLTQACDPNNSGECPGGQTCTLHLTNGTLASPYWGCE
jgi:hypothetical protein